MSINLLNMVKEVAGDSMIKQASSFLGAEESTTKTAFGAVLPSLLGSMIEKGSNDEGANSLLNFINTNNHDGSILDKVGDLLGGGTSADGLLNSGAGVLKFLVGEKLGSLTDLISKVSGLKVGNSSSLLKMVSPIIMGVAGRYIKTKALDALGLKNMLMGQRENVKNALPSGFSKIMGFSAFDNLGDQVSETVAKASDEVSEISTQAAGSAKSSDSKLMPWLLGILALVALIFLLRKGCSGTSVGDSVDNMAEQVEETAGEAVDVSKQTADDVAEGVGSAADAISDAISSISLPNGAEIKARAGSFLDNLVKFVSGGGDDPNRAFTFDNLNFQTGSDQITSESQIQLDNLVSVLNAYENVNIRVAGHTDNTGDAATNKTISEDRSKSVKAYLVNKGIAGSRIEAVGFGQENPIASNDSVEGRAQNRRVEVYVTKK